MRFLFIFFLFTILINNRFAFSENKTHGNTAAIQKESHPKESHPKQEQKVNETHSTVNEIHSEEEYDIFSIIPEKHQASFKTITDAYLNENIERAISETKRLMQQPGEIGETASFLLGDLYLRQKGAKNEGALGRSMEAFDEAIRKYPGSENAAKQILRRGTYYFTQKRYYAALDNFKMLFPFPKYAVSAKIGMARAFQKLGEWHKVIDTYPDIVLLQPSSKDLQIAKLIYADALYQLGEFEKAYVQYKDASSKMPDYYLHDPQSVFQFGEVSYQTKRYDEAKPLFKTYYETHAKNQEAEELPLVLARVSNFARIDGNEEKSEKAANAIYTMKLDRPGVRAGKLILSTGKLASLNCPNPCASEQVDQSLKHIEKEANQIFLETAVPSITTQGAVVDWLMELKRTSHFGIAEEVAMKFLATLPVVSPYKAHVKSFLTQTIYSHFETLEAPEEIVDLYRRFQPHFPPHKMNSEYGLKLAQSYLKRGKLSEAISFFRPVAGNIQSPASEEALYQLGHLLAQVGSHEKAQYVLEEYRNRYPKNHAILVELGDIYDRQGKAESAIDAYREWLSHHPKDPNRKKIYQKISDTYQNNNDLPNQILLYEEWIRNLPDKKSELPYMELADAYYQQKKHKNAIEFYRLALIYNRKKIDIDWARLRLASSYQAIGQKAKSEKIVQGLKLKAKDPLIKQIASEQGFDYETGKIKQ